MTLYELFDIVATYIGLVVSIIVAIISFPSVWIMYNDYKNRKEKERAEKAIEVAKDFALTIIPYTNTLYDFFIEFNIKEIIDKIDFCKLENFDAKELKTLYSEMDILNYVQRIEQNDPEFEIRDTICNTLNTLEYMCMYISSEVADEKYIYNSLHQQFLRTIALLYFEISLANTDNKDKYYTNIIHVYNIWKNKYLDAMEEEKEIENKKEQIERESVPKFLKYTKNSYPINSYFYFYFINLSILIIFFIFSMFCQFFFRNFQFNIFHPFSIHNIYLLSIYF